MGCFFQATRPYCKPLNNPKAKVKSEKRRTHPANQHWNPRMDPWCRPFGPLPSWGWGSMGMICRGVSVRFVSPQDVLIGTDVASKGLDFPAIQHAAGPVSDTNRSNRVTLGSLLSPGGPGVFEHKGLGVV